MTHREIEANETELFKQLTLLYSEHKTIYVKDFIQKFCFTFNLLESD